MQVQRKVQRMSLFSTRRGSIPDTIMTQIFKQLLINLSVSSEWQFYKSQGFTRLINRNSFQDNWPISQTQADESIQNYDFISFREVFRQSISSKNPEPIFFYFRSCYSHFSWQLFQRNPVISGIFQYVTISSATVDYSLQWRSSFTKILTLRACIQA